MTDKIAILMGSDSDLPTMRNSIDILEDFGVETTVKILSAHRTPKETAEFAENAEANGYKGIICAAGLAAHLAGVVAAHTTLPVLGCPMQGGVADGLDALLSTVQMPSGVPVATFGVGKHGANNAALFAISILALNNEDLKRKLIDLREEQAKKILAKNK
ncbi:5-(carboxyamino)imidazole ribonucleotide mutase [Planctomycetota bacterium]